MFHNLPGRVSGGGTLRNSPIVNHLSHFRIQLECRVAGVLEFLLNGAACGSETAPAPGQSGAAKSF